MFCFVWEFEWELFFECDGGGFVAFAEGLDIGEVSFIFEYPESASFSGSYGFHVGVNEGFCTDGVSGTIELVTDEGQIDDI